MKQRSDRNPLKIKIEDKEVFQALVETIPDMFFLVDLKGVIRNFVVNDENRLFLSPEMFIDKHIREVLPEHVVDLFEKGVLDYEATHKLVVFQYELSYPDGAKTFECRLNKMSTADFYVAIIRDITEMEKMNQALKTSEARYETMMENAPFPILVDSRETNHLLYANQRALELLSPEGMPLERIDVNRIYIHEENRQLFHSQMDQKSGLLDFEVQMMDRNDNPFWALISGIPIEFGEYKAYLMMINDITRLKKAIDELSNEKQKLKRNVTRLEQMQEVIKEKEGLLQIVFNQTGAGIVLIDPDTYEIVEYNKSAAEIHGYSLSEFKNISINQLQAQLSKKEVKDIVESVQVESKREFEVTHKKKDGSWIQLNSKLDNVSFNGKNYISCVWTDISVLKAAQQREELKNVRLQRDNQIFRDLNQLEIDTGSNLQKYFYDLTELLAKSLSLSRVSIWLFNEEGTELNCKEMYDQINRQHSNNVCLSEALFKTEIEHFKNSRYVDASDAYNDPRTSAYREPFLKALNLRAMLDCSIISGARTIGTVCFGYNEIRNWEEDEIILGCQIADHVGNTILNYERLMIAEQLKQSESFLKRAQEVSKTGHWVMDLKKDIIHWSDEVYRIYGLPVGKEINSEICLSFIHKEDFDWVLKAWERSKKGEPFHAKHRIVCPLETKWIEVIATVEYDESVDAVMALGTIQDITDRILTETELKKYRLKLEEMVFQRTAELEEAMDNLESASRAKTEFISNMSHEIRTPMNAIIGYAHLIKREPLSIKQGMQLEKLTNASMHLLQIVNDILDLSKIEANKLTIDNNEFEPAMVVDHVFEIVETMLTGKGLDFYIQMNDIPKTVVGDGPRFGQILLNLVNNAIKFTEKGSIGVIGSVVNVEHVGNETLKTADGESPYFEKWLRMEVKDTGIGLSDDQMNKLFVAFNQADRSTTRLYGGTGLGLAISKKLLTLMNGHIGVNSQLGEGSVFWFEIPLIEGDNSVENEGNDMTLSGLKVLVIDDDKDVLEITKEMLETHDFRVSTATSGSDGLEMILEASRLEKPFELVIVDYCMPEVNGITVIRTIKELPLEKQPDMIMITAFSHEIDREADEDMKHIYILPKPITPHKLTEALQHTLLKKSAQSGQLTEEQLKNYFATLGHKRVLLVEDNPINREVATQLLEFIDLEILTAENGKIAFEMAKNNEFDLVLMDVQMPIMDGIEATQLIRSLENWKATPIIAMTAHAFEEDIENCLIAGMNDHISKPVEPQKLYATLYKWLSVGNQDGEIEFSIKPVVNATEQDDGEVFILQSIEGLDVASGLLTMNGNVKSYFNLLGQFVENHGSDTNVFSTLLAEKDLDSLGKKAHALKGVSATLGAVKIQRLAKDLEFGAKQNLVLEELEKINVALTQELSGFIKDYQRVSEILKPERYQMKLGTINIGQMNELLSKLETLLGEFDTSVNDLIEETGGYLIEMFGDEARLLCNQINEFEYANAQNTLRLLMNLKNA